MIAEVVPQGILLTGKEAIVTILMPQDLKLPGDQVDVNVHPTKHEVVFLHQDEILACINEAVEGLLQGPIRCGC